MDNVLSYKPSIRTKARNKDLLKEPKGPIVHARHVSFNKTEEGEMVTIDLVNQPSAEERTTETCINETDLFLAATYIIDAKCSRNYVFKSDLQSLKNYHVYNHMFMQVVLYLFVFLDLSLAIFEEPALQKLAMPYWATQLLELACLTFFVLRMVHHRTFTPRRIWWTDHKNVILVIIIAVMCLDMILATILIETGAVKKMFRWSRIFRPLFLVNFPEMREIRRAFRNIRRSLPEIVAVLALLFLFIFLFALLARELFVGSDLKEVLSGKPYFEDYFENIWELYVLITTANSPDVMMPAYDNSGLFMTFYVVFVLLCNYIFMSIFLAVIYKNYRKHLKEEVRTTVFIKRRKLIKAWEILKVISNNKFVLTWKRWQAVMSYVLPRHDTLRVGLLWKVLDDDDDGTIEKREFLRVIDLLNIKLATVRASTPFFKKYMSTCYNSQISEFVCKLVKHSYFRYFFDFVIVVNAILLITEVDDGEWYFLGIFIVEILLKMYAYGFYKFFHNFWNIFDFVIIFSASVLMIAEEVGKNFTKDYTEQTLDFVLSLRVIRMLRVIQSIQWYQVIISTISSIGPSILTFGGILFVIYYVFAIIGMGAFSGLITYNGYGHGGDVVDPKNPYCGTKNPNFTKSEFYTHHYCNNNFNNIGKAYIVLFQLMIVNQWHVIADGFVLVTSKVARLFFIAFHIVVVVILVNIFIAFILEVFMVEYTISKNKNKFEGAIEKKIDELGLGVDLAEENPNGNSKPVKVDKLGLVISEQGETTSSETSPGKSVDPGIRFRLSKRHNVQLSLQAMFEGELDDENMGPEEVENTEEITEEENEPISYTLDHTI